MTRYTQAEKEISQMMGIKINPEWTRKKNARLVGKGKYYPRYAHTGHPMMFSMQEWKRIPTDEKRRNQPHYWERYVFFGCTDYFWSNQTKAERLWTHWDYLVWNERYIGRKDKHRSAYIKEAREAFFAEVAIW